MLLRGGKTGLQRSMWQRLARSHHHQSSWQGFPKVIRGALLDPIHRIRSSLAVAPRRCYLSSSSIIQDSGVPPPPSSPQAEFWEIIRELRECIRESGPSDAEKAFALVTTRLPFASSSSSSSSTANLSPADEVACFNVAIASCIRAEKLDKALELLDVMDERRNSQPNLLTYNLLVFGAARQGEIRRGMSLLDRMVQANIRPDTCTYHGLLMAAGKAKEKPLILQLLKQMHVQLPSTYTTAIAALARCGDWQTALTLIKEMNAEGIPPTTGAYHVAMFACCKASPARWTEAMDLLREMKSKGLEVGVIAYNMAILCTGLAHQVDAAQRLLHEMKQEVGLSPNNGTYRGLFKSLVQNGDYERCLQLLQEEMPKDGLVPDRLNYIDCMEVFSKKNPGASLRILDEMKKAKEPNLRNYLAPVIDADEAAERETFEGLMQEIEGLDRVLLKKGK